MKHNVFILCSFFLLSLSACGSDDEESASEVTAIPATEAVTNPEILLVTGEYAPYTGEALEGGGVTTAIVTAVFEEMGRPFRLEFYPWVRSETMVENGEAWATFPYARTPERETRFFFSEHTLGGGRTLWYYYGDQLAGVKYDTFSDLASYRIGGSSGYWYVETLTEAGLELDLVTDDLLNLNKLRSGRIDLFPMDENVARWMIASEFPEEVDQFQTLEQAYGETYFGLMVSQKYPETQTILSEFNASLQHLYDNGTFAAIHEEYGAPIFFTTTP